MDEIQKQILGYLLMAIIGSVFIYIAGKLELWILDPALLTSLSVMIVAFESAAYKWIKYTFNLPEEESVEIVEQEITA